MTTLSSAIKAPVVKDSYLDQNSLNSVKAMGRANDPAALKEISKKFEAMFVQQMLKSMRDANEVFADGDMFSSDQVKFHQEMLDQQMVLNLTSGEGMGIAKAMYRQMQQLYGKKAPTEESSIPAINTSVKGATETLLRPLSSSVSQNAGLSNRLGGKNAIARSAEDFIAKLKPYADKAAAELNVKSDVLLAQAALETGWGKHLIHDASGNNSFNIFNIKANGWDGKSVAVTTLENKEGVAQKERANFRQYDGYLQSFADYVSLIKNNPRYQKALAAGEDSHAYARELQKAGYATDPAYAAKIKSILNSDAMRSAMEPTKEWAGNETVPAANGEQA